MVILGSGFCLGLDSLCGFSFLEVKRQRKSKDVGFIFSVIWKMVLGKMKCQTISYPRPFPLGVIRKRPVVRLNF